MRDRDEILINSSQYQYINLTDKRTEVLDVRTVEVLLDIRDLLVEIRDEVKIIRTGSNYND
jgi:hypothetical protein